MQESTKMHDEITAVVDITDFQKNVSTVLESKGILSQFKNENVPAPKKSMAVHEAKVKTDNKKEKLEDSKELTLELGKKYSKEKMSAKDDTALQTEIVTL